MAHEVDIMRLSGTELPVSERLPIDGETDYRFADVDGLGHAKWGTTGSVLYVCSNSRLPISDPRGCSCRGIDGKDTGIAARPGYCSPSKHIRYGIAR